MREGLVIGASKDALDFILCPLSRQFDLEGKD
jgi:hypothetical protein